MAKNLNSDASSGVPENLGLTTTLPANHTYTGIYRDGMTAGENLDAFQVVYLKSDGKWWVAKANDVETAKGMLAVTLEAIAAESTGRLLLEGYIREDLWNWAPGGILYLSGATGGALTAVPPAGVGDVIRIVAYSATADIIWFNPSSTYIEVSSKHVNGVDLKTEINYDYIFGLAWDSSDSSPTTSLTYVDRNGDALATLPFTFNNHPIWGNIRRCTLTADGTIAYGSNNRGDGLILDQDDIRVMVEIPKFYVKAQSSAGIRMWWISPYPETGFEVHPAFKQRGGTTRDYIYVSAYETAVYFDGELPKLASKTGQTPTTAQNIGWFRTRAHSIGFNWGLMNVHTWSAIQLLFTVEYASLNSQIAFAPGIIDNPATVDTGAFSMDTQMDVYGTGVGTNTGTPYGNPISWRGIENPWGNVFSWIDGIEVYDDSIRIIKEDGTGMFDDPMASGSYQIATITPLTAAASGGCITNIGWDPTYCKYMFIPISGTGSDICNVYFCDNCFAHNVGEVNVVMVGGSKTSAGCAGLFRWDMDQTASEAYTNANARIEYIGPTTPA